MSPDTAELAARYYGDFASHGDFESVPMATDLQFSGPIHAYVGGDRYRSDCGELAAMVRAFDIRHQFIDGPRIHTVYDVDLGLPSGPIPTSETLTFRGGVMIAADLIIDSTPLRKPQDTA